ncbi:MAG: phosphotransferase, partial [bacterium]|nr:phosphotransferase [bacterium]
ATDCFESGDLVQMPLNVRIDRAIANYDKLKVAGAPIYHAEAFKECLLDAPHDAVQRQARILHGDFHVGNIIAADDGSLWAIDWVYGSFGDPIEDFARIFVSADICPAFARGQIDGYFEGLIPSNFWQDLKRYAALHQLEALSLSLGTMPNGQSVQEHQQALLLKQYNGMKENMPSFYRTKGERHES